MDRPLCGQLKYGMNIFIHLILLCVVNNIYVEVRHNVTKK